MGADVAPWTNLNVSPLVQRLRRLNEWRRGCDGEQPRPREIGEDIDAAADLLERMAVAIRATIEENAHLADGDDCTLRHLVRLSAGVPAEVAEVAGVAWVAGKSS